MKNISRFILKRSGCLNSSVDSYPKISFKTISSLMESKKLTDKNVFDYLDGLCSVKEANNEYLNPIGILNYYNENGLDDTYIVEKYCDMLYYVNPDIIKDMNKNIERYNISEKDSSLIKEATSIITLSDKLIHNHNTMSKRFDFRDVSFKMKHNNIKSMVESLATLIDTYNIPDYQKMNIAIEESVYLSLHNGCTDIDMDNLVYEISRYYLINTDEKVENIKRVLSENKIVSDMDTDYIFECGEDVSTNSISNLIDYIVSTGDYVALNHKVYHTIEATSYTDIMSNVLRLLELFDDISKNSDNKQIIIDSMEALNAALMKKGFSREQVEAIYSLINNFKEGNKVVRACVDNIEKSLDNDISYTYSGNNITAIQFVNQEGVSLPLPKFKKFKFNGILTAVHNLDRFLAKKERLMLGKIKKKADKFKKGLTSILFGESFTRDNLGSYIGSDNRVDVCVRQYPLDEFTSVNDLNNFMSSCIEEFNSSISDSNIRAYYTIIEGMAEIHIKDRTVLEMEDSELAEINESVSTESNLYYTLFEEVNNIVEEYSKLDTVGIKELIESLDLSVNFTREHFDLAVEAMKYLNITNEEFDLFCNKYSDISFNKALNENATSIDSFNEDMEILNISESWVPYDNVPYEISLEAMKVLNDIFKDAGVSIDESSIDDKLKSKGYYNGEDDEKEKSSDDKSDEDDDWDDDDEKDEKEEKKESSDKKPSEVVKLDKLPKDDYKVKTSLNLSNVKLVLKGIYSKFKDMNTKQKEISKNLDNAIKTFIKGIKDADSNERREQIIKGSIIPSFSKCIKFGILLAGLGVATGGMAVPIITALGGFALDKKLTKKERILLLDEIETELEVIEKELAIADSNNQINKYRALLRYKKDLQRQYQRIRYNVRVGQDSGYFKSSTGVSD